MKIDVETYDWDHLKQNVAKAKSIRNNLEKARDIIKEGMLRYIKSKIKARNKKQAEDMELVFKDLADYKSKAEIQEAYGYDFISETEMRRLQDLWDARETYVDESGKFSDEVTNMLDSAIRLLGEQYHEFLEETDQAQRIVEEQRRKAAFGKL